MSTLTLTPSLPLIRPLPAMPLPSLQKAVPIVAGALLVASAGVALGRLVRGREENSTQDRLSESLVIAGAVAGLFLLSKLAKGGSGYRIGSWSDRQLYPPTTQLWPHPPTRNPRSNQEIFDAVIARYRTQKRAPLSRFEFVDFLLCEKGVQTQSFQRPDGLGKITIIDMRGVKAKDLDLKEINFSRGYPLYDKYIIDFTGAQFDRMKLKNCYFEHCIFDGATFNGFEFAETYFARCQFGRGSRLQGKVEIGSFQDCQFNDAQIQGSLFKGTDQNTLGFKNCRFQGSTVENCRFEKFAFESEWSDPLPSIRSTAFTRCEFEHGNFNHPHILESSFRGCRFRGVGFSTRFRLYSVDFSSLPKIDPTGQTIFEECYFGIQGEMRSCHFRGVDFLSTNFSSGGSNNVILFERCDFSHATFRQKPQSAYTTGFAGCEFQRCNFTAATFDPAVRFDQTVDPTLFDSCNFTDAWFSEQLPTGHWKGVEMKAANVEWRGWNIFRRTHLDGVIWNYPHQILPPTPGGPLLPIGPAGTWGPWRQPAPPPSPTPRLIEGDFTGASLRDANLFDRDLGRSIFPADLRGTTCQLTDLSRCQELEKALVDGMTILRQAKLPRHLRGRSPIGILGLNQGAVFN